MSEDRAAQDTAGHHEVVTQLRHATGAKKCWTCRCLHQSLETIERTLGADARSAALSDVIEAARGRLLPVKYDCLGCAMCYPALAINARAEGGLGDAVDIEVCPRDAVQAREGWPPLPGAYQVLRYRAPVAVCTLPDDALATALTRVVPPAVALVGTLQTENLGIERLILNVLANPSIRFLIVCGADSRQAIGHLPGQSQSLAFRPWKPRRFSGSGGNACPGFSQRRL